jgi:hypothetical protein
LFCEYWFVSTRFLTGEGKTGLFHLFVDNYR